MADALRPFLADLIAAAPSPACMVPVTVLEWDEAPGRLMVMVAVGGEVHRLESWIGGDELGEDE